ncbi:MAG TPA: exonuclease domain-containing protein, partial [Thermomicrobiales bacterium]|nr:exonuclease domain-containing protein [Thermomicrobiales bacterium]
MEARLFLSQRARDFVTASGGAVHEDLLIGHIFGSTRTPELWRALFYAVMRDTPELRVRGEREWVLSDGVPQIDIAFPDFVALDVETTGLRPASHRVIEIGMIRYSVGEPVERFQMLFDPERKLPAYITKLTGIRDVDLRGQDFFSTHAATIEEFIGDALIVGHNVMFDIGFLNAELRRAGRMPLVNDRVDTMALAMRYLPDLRRASLDKVASALGLAPRKIHRAEDDAELTARAALVLFRIAAEHGDGSLDALKATSRLPEARPRDGIGRGRALLDTDFLKTIPSKPGVYLMLDANKRVIYVGKAKDLRDRVGSYYSQPLGYTRKMDGLLESIAEIDVRVVGSELDALMLEAQLIKRYQPRYNTVMRSHEQYPYIKVDLASPWPRIQLAPEWKNDGCRYFGPYRNRSAAKQVVELLNVHFQLRTCTRSFKTARSYGSPCLKLSLKQCLGPCAGKADRDIYMERIRSALRFLEGNDAPLLQRIWEHLETAAATGDFEHARRLRRDIQILQSIAGVHRVIQEMERRPTLLLALPTPEPDRIDCCLVVSGRIWSRTGVSRWEVGDDIHRRVSTSLERMRRSGSPQIDPATVDEAFILDRWLNKHWGHPAILNLGTESLPDA